MNVHPFVDKHLLSARMVYIGFMGFATRV